MAATMTLAVTEYLCLTTGTTSGAGTAYTSSVFSKVPVPQFLASSVFCR